MSTPVIALIVIVSCIVLISAGLFIMWAVTLRQVVPTNYVHITQSKKGTTEYGKGLPDGNVYYHWPEWLPKLGISVTSLPTSIFDVDLTNYAAYDIERVPFSVDVKAFFQIDSPAIAAHSVASFEKMIEQLNNTLKSAVRKILSSSDIETIMSSRKTLGDCFTAEVGDHLSAWGVKVVRNIEFTDIRDVPDSQVIHNMMVKKQSAIAKDSRVAVANNERDARLSEIDAVKEANIRQQEADLLVGQKKADKDRGIAIATEQAQQEIATQKKITAEKTMQVLMVEQSKQADIDKEVAVIQANKNKDMVAIAAEAELIRQEKGAQGELIKQLKHAEGTLKQQQNEAEGKLAFGKAIAESEKLLQMAPITAQIALAKEIGENASYQQYLLSLEGLKTVLAVGVAKAEALKAADIKVIANTGTAEKGIDSVGDMFSAQGGLAVGSMLEALGNTEIGKAVLDKITAKK